ncbi:MAG TPA: 2,3-diphosphoglycerate-dependent phosphoglycerate mutase [Acidimicrobiales bacterium]|nr:2,3-diphosphoglycerate-dependent phosphoglycerate mutase [Acidimicrobiales bacterium]
MQRATLGDVPDLVLLRHGQSTWNAEGLFTGWVDVDLSPRGEAEARQAGKLIAAEQVHGLDLRVLHTSVLTRAVRTANLALEELDRTWLPVRRHWRLNERHYGSLQGKNKKETTAEFGIDKVKVWRRSYTTRPPALDRNDPQHPANDPRYRDVPASALPASECLADVVARMVPYWEDAIVADLHAVGAVLVVAHGNSLRALVKYLTGLSDDEVVELEIPTGVPWCFSLADDLSVRDHRQLGDPEAINAAIQETAHQAG